jgi:hypothetical protein
MNWCRAAVALVVDVVFVLGLALLAAVCLAGVCALILSGRIDKAAGDK